MGERIPVMEEIKSIIMKSLESANKNEIAEAYFFIVSCGDCPYYNDCRNEHYCEKYILDKLDTESEV